MPLVYASSLFATLLTFLFETKCTIALNPTQLLSRCVQCFLHPGITYTQKCTRSEKWTCAVLLELGRIFCTFSQFLSGFSTLGSDCCSPDFQFLDESTFLQYSAIIVWFRERLVGYKPERSLIFAMRCFHFQGAFRVTNYM